MAKLILSTLAGHPPVLRDRVAVNFSFPDFQVTLRHQSRPWWDMWRVASTRGRLVHHKHQPLHVTINPKDCKVSSPLVIQGFSNFFRVVSSDYGKLPCHILCILLMEEIPHHLGCIKTLWMVERRTNLSWCRISSIRSSKRNMPKHNWAVLSDEQMSKRWPFSLLNNEQMSNWLGVEHQPDKRHVASRSGMLGV